MAEVIDENAIKTPKNVCFRPYGAGLSKLPPFDIAVNTERVPLGKTVETIALLHKRREVIG